MQDLSTFNSDSFDLVTSRLAVGALDDIRKAFSEVFGVLKDQGTFTFSETHPVAEKGHWERDSRDLKLHRNFDDYFDRSVVSATWYTKDGEVVEISYRHRTLQDYFDALTSVGFVVERLVEPEPIDKRRALNIEVYENAKRIPYFILFKARKPI